MASGRRSTSPLQPILPQAIEAMIRRMGFQRSFLWSSPRSRIEGEDRPRQADQTGIRNRAKVSTIIGAREG